MGHRGLEVTVHRPVLGSLGQQWSTIDSFSVLFFLANRCYLVVAEGDGEPSIVAVDDLNAVVSRAAGKREDYTKTFYTHRKNVVLVNWCIISTFYCKDFVVNKYKCPYPEK